MKILRDNFTFQDEGMSCGSYEAEVRTYQKIVDKRGHVWLISQQCNAADYIYYHNPKDFNSNGFAGRTISFTLTDGSVYEAKGPWHSNSDALLKATGIDLSNKHFTQVAIGLKRGSQSACILGVGDVIYLEEQPQLGYYNRYKDIALEFANELNTIVFIAMQSEGGGSGNWVAPTNWIQEQINEFFQQIKG